MIPKKLLLLAFHVLLYGLGAVLSHLMPDGSQRRITFASRTLSKAEHKYSQIEKEALTIDYTVKNATNICLGDIFYHILTISHF